MRFERIAFLGCGNMGRAMLAGWAAGGMDMARITIVKPSDTGVPDGAAWFANAAVAADAGPFDVLVLGVKPQLLADVRDKAARLAGPDTVVVSLLAGVEVAALARLLPGRRILRLMPNIAVARGASPLALHGPTLDADERAAVAHWLGPLGTPAWIEDEGQMPAVTALVGSGPAFLYRFVDALAGAAEALGVPGEAARHMAIETVRGAAELAAGADESPSALADRVASKGGSTRAGLDVLDADGALSDLVRRTLRAARDRNRELAALGDGPAKTHS